MSKYYYDESCESMATLKSWREFMIENDIRELKLFEAKVEYGTGYFICTVFDEIEISEVGNCSNKFCDKYEPRNGIKGICNHYGYTYEQTDKVKILKLN